MFSPSDLCASASLRRRFVCALFNDVAARRLEPLSWTLMAIAFHHAASPPLIDLDAVAPDGAVIGIVGENGSGKTRLLRLAAGVDQPVSGVVECSGAARFLGPLDALNLAPTPVLLMDGTLAQHDWLVRERT